ncbi:hypothetical protein [Sphingomonas sp. MMS24-J13]|uniref:hypothetical protein n=1 Tax=Sphingomonas sp. MMS24-J13 TaxID=3238686 RepID=UPI00384E5E4F
MRRTALWGSALALAIGATAPASAQAPGARSAVISTACMRDCLIGHVRAYMKALLARNPAALPVVDDIMFTENDVAMPLGEGLWGTIDYVAPTGLEVADAETKQAAWFGVVREHGNPAYLGLRIHVTDDGRIDEVESVVHRKTGLPAPFGDPDKVEHDPVFQDVLPIEQRRPRQRLMAVADSYFNTVEQNDGQVFAPFDDECGRLENGISTTAAKNGMGAASIASGCEAQFKLGIYRINKRVRERRFPLIDEERGIVVATGFFDHANAFDQYKLTNGNTMKTALKWPNSITLLEAFRIRDGKIHRVEAIFTYVPYFMHNPWEDRK